MFCCLLISSPSLVALRTQLHLLRQSPALPVLPADKVPAERERAVPPASEIQALRAPAVEAVFAEYHAQLAGTATAAEGQEEAEGEQGRARMVVAAAAAAVHARLLGSSSTNCRPLPAGPFPDQQTPLSALSC